VPDLWRAQRAALPDQPLRRQADPFLARRTRLATSPLPDLQGAAGAACKTPTGRRASQPHTARLQRGRRELFAEEQVWEELERWEAAVALVRFSGGGGQGAIAAVTLEHAKKCELARWGSGEGELPEALAAPIWGRYALFRGRPRISGLLMWDVRERQVVIAGERGGQKFEELVSAPRQLYRPAVTPVAVSAADTPRRSAARRDTSRGAGAGDARLCERCGEPLPAGRRAEARYCSKRCRQAASRARLKDRPPSPSPSPPETCSWCGGPMPGGLRVEARFCSKRCRQASSRHTLRVRRSAAKTSSPHDSPRRRGAKAQG
jgi:predicted nucleic acid-binding Zn ribbon protein